MKHPGSGSTKIYASPMLSDSSNLLFLTRPPPETPRNQPKAANEKAKGVDNPLLGNRRSENDRNGSRNNNSACLSFAYLAYLLPLFLPCSSQVALCSQCCVLYPS